LVSKESVFAPLLQKTVNSLGDVGKKVF
ncbi:tetratricopeptide repeat protein, partial [Chlamydia suis MD56]